MLRICIMIHDSRFGWIGARTIFPFWTATCNHRRLTYDFNRCIDPYYHFRNCPESIAPCHRKKMGKCQDWPRLNFGPTADINMAYLK